MFSAKKAFQSLGNFLKKKRHRESEQYLSSLIDVDAEKDPATNNPELLEKFKKNKKEGDEKLNEIFKLYVDKQEGLSNEELERQKNMDSNISDDSESENSKKQKIQESSANSHKEIEDHIETNTESSIDDDTNEEQNHKNKVENLMKKTSDNYESKNKNYTVVKSNEKQKDKTKKDDKASKKTGDSCIDEVSILDENPDKEKRSNSHLKISNSDSLKTAQNVNILSNVISLNKSKSSETSRKIVPSDKNKTNLISEDETKNNEGLQILCDVFHDKEQGKNSIKNLTQAETNTQTEDIIEILEIPEETSKSNKGTLYFNKDIL